jgi:phosphoribosylaminoimidazole-succinocarboxamide synthase
MGSVKDLKIIKPAYENFKGIENFIFSDRYSIFDWGEMPDHIENKGKALAVMAAFNFEELYKRGIKNHYRGLVGSDNKLIEFPDLEEGSNGSNIMQVNMAVVYKPIARKFVDEDGKQQITYDYSFFTANRGKINNYLIGLEIIFRNGLPLGSSVFKKIDEAKKIEDLDEREQKLRGIYEKLGVDSEPKPGDMLPKPVINYTTKLEEGDRNLSEDEAYDISGLKLDDFLKVAPLARRVNDYITEQAERTGLSPHWDGKVEMAYSSGDLGIVDVIGTLDENRFGNLVSKEVLRQFYRKNQPEFAPACEEWKQTGEGWQKRCPVKPISLPTELATLVSQMYMAACNSYTEKRIFNVPEMERVMEKLEPYR